MVIHGSIPFHSWLTPINVSKAITNHPQKKYWWFILTLLTSNPIPLKCRNPIKIVKFPYKSHIYHIICLGREEWLNSTVIASYPRTPPPTVDESPWPRASATHAFVQSRCLDVPRVTQKNGMKRWKNMEK